MALFRRRRDDGVVASPPGPVTRADIAQRLTAAAPGSGGTAADRLVPAVRYATRPEPDAAIDVAQTKFGGAPDLPQGTPWPMWTTPEGERRALQFFAQIDLAGATAAAPGPLPFPADGQLSFFADFDPAGGPTSEHVAAAVLFSPRHSVFVRCALRMVPLPTAELAPVGIWSWPVPADAGELEGVEKGYEMDLAAQVGERHPLSGRHQLGGHLRSPRPLPAGEIAVLQLGTDDAVEMPWHAGLFVWSVKEAEAAVGEWTAARFSLA